MIWFGLGVKNFFRVVMALFWITTIILQLNGTAKVLEWLWNEHVFYWTGLVLFSFWLFEPKGKQKNGGEKIK